MSIEEDTDNVPVCVMVPASLVIVMMAEAVTLPLYHI